MKARFPFTWAAWFLLAVHLLVLLAGFIAPYSFETQQRLYPYAPPAHIHFVDCQGKFHLRPFVYTTRLAEGSAGEYAQDCSQPARLQLFAVGDSYTLLGVFHSRR